jgi:DNA-binding beta-propeller fold protein YncE
MGTLSEAKPPVALPDLPITIALDASGELVYVTNGMNVSVFRLDKVEGKLTEIEGSPFRVGTDQQPGSSGIVIMSATSAGDY